MFNRYHISSSQLIRLSQEQVLLQIMIKTYLRPLTLIIIVVDGKDLLTTRGLLVNGILRLEGRSKILEI